MSEAARRSPYRTIPVRPETWERLRALRMGGATYDQVINDLMDMVPVERVSKRFLREQEHRLRTFQGIPLSDLRKKYEKEDAHAGRRGAVRGRAGSKGRKGPR